MGIEPAIWNPKYEGISCSDSELGATKLPAETHCCKDCCLMLLVGCEAINCRHIVHSVLMVGREGSVSPTVGGAWADGVNDGGEGHEAP